MIGDKKNNNNQQGFSLVEMVVAVSIFVFVILMVTSIFQNSIIVQKNAIATQSAQEGIRYAMEVISKEVRSATININPSDATDFCQPITNLVGDIVHKVYNEESGVFYFRNRLGDCVDYRLVGGRLFIDRDSVDLPITPGDVEITNFQVEIDDDEVNEFHATQPNVTILIDLKSNLDNFNEIKMQTSISSRYYE